MKQLLESIVRERHFLHLVRAAWLLNNLIFTYSHGTDVLFLSVSDVPPGRAVGTVPAQEEAGRAAAQPRAGRQEPQQPERARGRSWQLAAMDAGAVSILPGLLQFPALSKPKHSEQAKSLSAGWIDLV